MRDLSGKSDEKEVLCYVRVPSAPNRGEEEGWVVDANLAVEEEGVVVDANLAVEEEGVVVVVVVKRPFASTLVLALSPVAGLVVAFPVFAEFALDAFDIVPTAPPKPLGASVYFG